jgi:hypothetical protein
MQFGRSISLVTLGYRLLSTGIFVSRKRSFRTIAIFGYSATHEVHNARRISETRTDYPGSEGVAAERA